MKKITCRIIKKIGFSIMVMLLLCACENQYKLNYNRETVSEEVKNKTLSGDVQDFTEMEENVDSILNQNTPMSVKQAFRLVLLNEKEFFCTDKIPYEYTDVIIDFQGVLSEIPYGYPEKTSIVQFAVADMDGDTIPEIILEIDEYYGYIILRYSEGNIYGNVTNYRNMSSLNTYGTFESSGGAADGAIEKFYFIGDTIIENKAMQMKDENTFYAHDKISNRETWDAINDLFDQSLKVEWYQFTEEKINECIEEDPLFTELSPEISENVKERQLYLESLSYLIEYTYDIWKKNPEEYKESAIKYYSSCMYEMNRIYQLCQQKLTGGELEAFQEEQQRWKADYEQRLNEELEKYQIDSVEGLLEIDDRYRYYSYGDIVLRRIFRMIDIYYDFRFYESLYN